MSQPEKNITPSQEIKSPFNSFVAKEKRNLKLDLLVETSLSEWSRLSAEEKMSTNRAIDSQVRKHRSVDRGSAAASLIKWKEGIFTPDSLGNDTTLRDKKPSFMRELVTFLEPEDFDVVGNALQKAAGENKTKEEVVAQIGEKRNEENAPAVTAFPSVVVEKMVNSFEETGYINYTTKDKLLRLTEKGKQSELGHNALKNIVLAHDLLNLSSTPLPMETIGDINDSYELSKQSSKVDDVEMIVRKPSSKVLYLSEILLGNNASDIKFLKQTIDTVSNMPAEDKPDAIVVSGLPQGNFKYRQKERRSTLVPELASLDKQFRASKLVLDELRTIGAPILYSMSNDDREIARQGTLETLKIIENVAKPLGDKSKGHISYWQEDQLRQKESFDRIYRFQLDVVLPYCLRSGRRLRSADEVAEITNGRMRTEEFLLLHEAYKAASTGETIPDIHKEVLEIDNIPFPGKKFDDFKFVDDVDLTLSLRDKRGSKKQDVSQMIRHNIGLTDVTMPINPIASIHAATRHMTSEGMETANGTVITGQQLMLGVGGPDGKWIMSTGGFTDGFDALKQRGSIASAGKSPAWREATTRKILSKPSAEMHEYTDDGRHILTIFNEKLKEKSYAIPERQTIVQLTDWQNGSTTARPDLQMKYLHMATEIMKDRPVHFIADGDIIHGDIYSAHKTENAHMGLIGATEQQKFVIKMLEKGTEHLTAAELKNFMNFRSVPGNHEYENGNRDNSNVPNEYLITFFKNLLKSRGIQPKEGQVQGYGTVLTERGDFYKTWTGFEKDVAGYGVLFKHKLLEKGAKGNVGIPVYQAKTLIEGFGVHAKDVDLGLFGHWHHPQYMMMGDKVGVVGPAIAGASGFEADRGYQAVIGGTFIHLGGGRDPQVEFLSLKTLQEHKITDGYYSDKNLRTEGYTNDRDFDAGKHGYVQRPNSGTQSALQKALWDETYKIAFAADSKI